MAQRYNKDHLRLMSKHLHYELWMVTTLANELIGGQIGTPTHNARLESFLVHVRILTDFLFSKRGTKCDMIADDFFHDPLVWKRARGKMSKILDIHSRVGKEIVHLSHERAERTTPATKVWNFAAIATEIIRVMDIFTQNVSKDLLSKEWRAGK